MLAHLLASSDEFEASAMEASNCPSPQHGGNVGQIGRGHTVPEFEEALFADVSTGIVPHLVSTRYGFHIVRIDRCVPGKTAPFAVARERITGMLSEQMRRIALRRRFTYLT